MSTMNMDHLRLIDDLQSRYMVALDGKKMSDWVSTFAAEASYICKTLESEQAGWAMALILDDCRGRIEDRVKFVEKIWAGTFQDYQTRHLVQRVECTPAETGLYKVSSHFHVMFTRSDTGVTGVLASGVYHDLIEVQGEQALFRSRKAVIDAPLLPHYIVYPI